MRQFGISYVRALLPDSIDELVEILNSRYVHIVSFDFHIRVNMLQR